MTDDLFDLFPSDRHSSDRPTSGETERTAALLARVKARGDRLRSRRRRLLTASAVGAAAVVIAVAVIVVAVVLPPSTTTGRGRPQAGGPVPTTAPPRRPGSSTVPARLLARGVQSPLGAIPWTQVGPGWTLATWGQSPAEPPGGTVPSGAVPLASETVTLFLVNPIGGRYAIKTFPPGSSIDLAAWSPDGRRALLTATTADGSQETVTEIDLSDGSTVNTFTVAGGVDLAYTEPDGLAILASNDSTGEPTLERLDRQGATELSYPSTFTQVGTYRNGFLSSPDGTQIVMGTSSGLALVDNDGTVVHQIPMAGSCDPQRWWSTGVVVASCTQSPPTPDGADARLWLVPVSGATPASPTPLEAANPDPGRDLGDLDAWSVGGATIVQASGACGHLYVARLLPNGTTAPLSVPGTDNANSELIKGTYGDLLAVQGTLACGAGQTLLWFNPADSTTNLILGPPLNGGGVIDALVYPDER